MRQHLKDPTDPQWANDSGVKKYKEIIALCPTCKAEDAFNLFGVAQAFTMVDVLKQAGTNLSRSNVMSIAANRINEINNPFVIPGVVVKTTLADHFPIMQVQVIKRTRSRQLWRLLLPLRPR